MTTEFIADFLLVLAAGGIVLLSLRGKSWAQSILLVSLSLLFSFAALEYSLRSGLFYHNLIWAPIAARAADVALDEANERVSARHPDRFNDDVHPYQHQPGKFRIAILGDSFVWGDGLRSEDRWSKKLEAKFQATGCEVEVMHWGRRGWSTSDELKYLTSTGLRYAPDYLVVSWTSNDPDVKRYGQKYLRWPQRYKGLPLIRLFPESYNFITSFIVAFQEEHSHDYGYENWMRKLYGEDNLQHYSVVLSNFAQTCEEANLPVTFFLLPNSHHPIFTHYHGISSRLLNEAKLAYVDLYPSVRERLSEVPIEDLRANRADGHPGPAINDVFADEAYQFLRQKIPSGFCKDRIEQLE